MVLENRSVLHFSAKKSPRNYRGMEKEKSKEPRLHMSQVVNAHRLAGGYARSPPTP